MAFPCKRCDYSATTKASLIRHLMSKCPCEEKHETTARETLIEQLQNHEYKTDTINCPCCNKLISKCNLARHKKACKQNKQVLTQTLDSFEDREQCLIEDLRNAQTQVVELREELQNLKQVLYQREQEIEKLQQTHAADEVVASRAQTSTTMIATKTKKSKISQAIRIVCWNTYIGEEKGKAPCLCCKTISITQHNFHCGHVLAEANGGKIQVENLRPICAVCNNSMGTMNMKQFALDHFNVEI